MLFLLLLFISSAEAICLAGNRSASSRLAAAYESKMTSPVVRFGCLFSFFFLHSTPSQPKSSRLSRLRSSLCKWPKSSFSRYPIHLTARQAATAVPLSNFLLVAFFLSSSLIFLCCCCCSSLADWRRNGYHSLSLKARRVDWLEEDWCRPD